MSFFALILKNLVRQRVRTALTVLGISIGITTVVALGVITESLKATAGEIIQLGGADFMVAQEGAADLSFSIVEEEDAARLASHPGVERAEVALFHIVRVGSNPFFVLLGRRTEEVAANPPSLVAGDIWSPGSLDQVLLGQRAARLIGLLDSVFVDDARVATEQLRARFSAEAARSAGPIPAVSTSTTAAALGLLPQYPDGLGRPVRTYYGNVSEAEIEPIDIDRITVLLAGGDAGPGRTGLRTDVMILASIDPVTHEAVLVSISRELTGFILPRELQKPLEWRQDTLWSLAEQAEDVGNSLATDPLPEEMDPAVWLDRINAVYPYSSTLDALYPGGIDPGMEALRQTLQQTLGIRIDFYVLVDFAGFVDMVDAIGGIDVTAREPMHVQFSPAKEGEEDTIINIQPGRHHFDGRLALAYVRNRSDSSDLVRTRRQRCLLREIAAQLDPLTVFVNFNALATAIGDHTTTNLPIRLLPNLISAVAQLDA